MASPSNRRETRTWLDQVRLFVKVVEARNLLRATPRGPRRNHGYVTVTYSGQGYQTKTIRGSENPRWENTEFLFMVTDRNDTIIEVELRSQQSDAPDRSDPILGVINLNFSNMKPNEAYRFWYAMQPPNEPPRDLSSEDIFLELFILDIPRLSESQTRCPPPSGRGRRRGRAGRTSTGSGSWRRRAASCSTRCGRGGARPRRGRGRQAEQARRQSPGAGYGGADAGLVHKLREEIAILKSQALEQQRQLAAVAAASQLGPLAPNAPHHVAGGMDVLSRTGRVNDPRAAAACCPLAAKAVGIKAGVEGCIVS